MTIINFSGLGELAKIILRRMLTLQQLINPPWRCLFYSPYNYFYSDKALSIATQLHFNYLDEVSLLPGCLLCLLWWLPKWFIGDTCDYALSFILWFQAFHPEFIEWNSFVLPKDLAAKVAVHRYSISLKSLWEAPMWSSRLLHSENNMRSSPVIPADLIKLSFTANGFQALKDTRD